MTPAEAAALREADRVLRVAVTGGAFKDLAYWDVEGNRTRALELLGGEYGDVDVFVTDDKARRMYVLPRKAW